MNDTFDNSHDDFSDIIGLPHYEPKSHKRMSMEARAAQFAAFAALNGHDEAIDETARLTDSRPDIDGADAEMLDRKLMWLRQQLPEHPEIVVTYFRPDERKEGGACVKVSGSVRVFNECDGLLVFTDGRSIAIKNIVDLTGRIFDALDE